MEYLLYIAAGIAGILIGRMMAKRKVFASKEQLNMARKDSKKALSERTDKRKDKILDFMKEARDDFKMGCNLREGENKQGISCEDVEKLLDVSDVTARNYLNELEGEGKIKQIGSSGRGVYYILAE